MKHTKKKVLVLASAIMAILFVLTGCGGQTTAASSEGSGTEVSTDAADSPDSGNRTLRVAYRRDDIPMTYEDENGYATGFNVELFRVVEEYLPGYTFEYIPSSTDDLYLGLSAGDYDIGLCNAAYTQDRAEKYTFPSEHVGGSMLVAIVRNEHADVNSLDDIYEQGLRITPLQPNNGITFAVQQYNQFHPDQQIEFEYISDLNPAATDNDWVADGRYDVNLTLQILWDARVEAEDGVDHDLFDKLTCNPVLAMKVYPLLSRQTLDDDFTEELDEAIRKAREDPRVVEISERFYGTNVFEYPYAEGL